MATIPPSPRRVRLSERGRQFRNGTLFFILPCLLAALWLTINIPRHFRDREALQRDGRDTTARIVKFGRFGRSSELWVKYVFAVQGKSFGAEVTVPASFEDSLSQAEYLRVRYLPANPENNHPADWEWTAASEMGWLVPLAWGIPGLLLASLLHGQRKLAVKGVATMGTVKSCTPRKGGLEIAYEFRAQDGSRVIGSGWSADNLKDGSRIQVLFLQGKPSQSLPYPLRNYQIIDSSS
jgi:hypothetical protein